MQQNNDTQRHRKHEIIDIYIYIYIHELTLMLGLAPGTHDIGTRQRAIFMLGHALLSPRLPILGLHIEYLRCASMKVCRQTVCINLWDTSFIAQHIVFADRYGLINSWHYPVRLLL